LSGSFAFIPGKMPTQPGPLARFLPPIPEGVAGAWLLERFEPGGWVLDPFGASPRLAAEAAHAGFRILVAANNPIERFLLEITSDPPTESELRAALADLATAPKAGERIEPHILSLYRTECAQCGHSITAEAFIWERGAPAPSGRIYHCTRCGDNGERPTTPADAERAAQFSGGSIHRMRALERVAPLDDPDRPLVEEALDTYPPRAVYALITLINKLASLPKPRQRLLTALLLPVLDQSNSLWHHPTSRSRPRQLTTPPRFREQNIWFALEEAIKQWANSTKGVPAIPLTLWPEQPPASGGISLYPGPLRELADQVTTSPLQDIHFTAALGAIPRPNQAYWTLSALWAGWIWGHGATAHFKSVLRRRRYDWDWHAVALHAACKNLAEILLPGIPFLGLIGETEPGYLAAALIAAEMSGFVLNGIAMRADEGQSQILWERNNQTRIPVNKDQLNQIAVRAVSEYLAKRGEPANYAHLNAKGLFEIIYNHSLDISPLVSAPDLMSQTQEAIHSALADRTVLIRIGGTDRSPESGYWWLRQPKQGRVPGTTYPLPLADQVEMALIHYLQNHPGCSPEEIDRAICTDFPGLFTPDQELIHECLSSYGSLTHPEGNLWQLRPQDDPKTRRADLALMHSLLTQIGQQLGFRVSESESPAAPGQLLRQPVYWSVGNEDPTYVFYILASAAIGNILFLDQRAEPGKTSPHLAEVSRQYIIVPGGRARLIGYKTDHNPILKQALETGWQIIKFRHIRRLFESTQLRRDNLDELLALDPLANTDPQMALL
jgi:hypothetical protein